MKIKICGITKEEEIGMLNDAGVDYAGFVFYEKSKRNISVKDAAALKSKLVPSIKSVAVTVSPDVKLAEAIEEAGFDIIQIHKELRDEVISKIHIPIWRAVNISGCGDTKDIKDVLNEIPEQLRDRIEAVVVDAAKFGSGKTFDWEGASFDKIPGVNFVLAGGLDHKNVAKGIALFSPDVVDVSSAVEGENGKDKDKVTEFVKAVKMAEETGGAADE